MIDLHKMHENFVEVQFKMAEIFSYSHYFTCHGEHSISDGETPISPSLVIDDQGGNLILVLI
jgi:hypothetical protein